MADLDKDLKAYTKALEDEFDFAASVALNDAAFAVRDRLGQAADETFEGGAAAFTKKAFRVSKKARKRDLEAEVLTKDRQSEYLSRAIFGGKRRAGDYATSKKAGVLIPGAASRRNKQGNLTRSYISKQLARDDTFLGRVRIKGASVLGVFQRKRGRRKGTRGPLKVLGIFKREVNYTRTEFDFVEHSKDTFEDVMQRSMSEAVDDLRTHGRVRTSNQRRRG